MYVHAHVTVREIARNKCILYIYTKNNYFSKTYNNYISIYCIYNTHISIHHNIYIPIYYSNFATPGAKSSGINYTAYLRRICTTGWLKLESSLKL